MCWLCGARIEATGSDRWVPPIPGTPGQGPHVKSKEKKILVAGHGPEDNDECPQL